jgi:hypothetical protein
MIMEDLERLLADLWATCEEAREVSDMSGAAKHEEFRIGQPRSIVRELSDTRTAHNFAVECIGRALNAAGGLPMMAKAFDVFEERHGETAGGWLDARWNGVGTWSS